MIKIFIDITHMRQVKKTLRPHTTLPHWRAPQSSAPHFTLPLVQRKGPLLERKGPLLERKSDVCDHLRKARSQEKQL